MSHTIVVGDCRAALAAMQPASVHCCVTSPPYWGLRNYNLPPSVWGGDPDCAHVWTDESVATEVGRGNWAQAVNGRGEVQGDVAEFREPIRATAVRGTCTRCGAWRGQFGLEPTPEMYVEHIVEVFRAVRRVLRDDATLWLNIGDSYAANRPYQVTDSKHIDVGNNGAARVPDGLKPKDLVGIPWRVAFALQADGWYLRSDIIWAKPNPMPESVRDRPTKSHEYVFLLSKAERYYYDSDSIAERNQINPNSGWAKQIAQGRNPATPQSKAYSEANRRGLNAANENGLHYRTDGRNRRSVWHVATQPFPDAHFATYPPKLIEPCILAGTSEQGCCAACGAPRERVVNRTATVIRRSERTHSLGRTRTSGTMLEPARSETIGWQPICSCNAGFVPCTVLDPFAGSGTTGVVAIENGRNAVLIELNPEYARMAERRCNDAQPSLFSLPG